MSVVGVAVSGREPATPLLRAGGLSKSFTGTHALDRVDLDLFPGEVHALVGQNGSGKSTLIKILSGYHTPDAGSVIVGGEQLHLPIQATDAFRVGLRFVHQDPGLCPTFSVLETIRMPIWSSWYRPIPWERERAYCRERMKSVGLVMDPDTEIRSLTPSQRAVVAILRALEGIGESPAALILDEPTASLNIADTERLFETLRELKGRGHAILFVSHRLDEIISIADRITVLRDGRLAAQTRPGETDETRLIESILGRSLGELYPSKPTVGSSDAVLRASHLVGGSVADFSCEIRPGEIVGVTGLGGMGQDEVPYLIFGARPIQSGEVRIRGKRLDRVSPKASANAGIAMLPADRAIGGVPRATLAENVTMGTIDRFFSHGWLRSGTERTEVQSLLAQFEVRPPDPDRMLGTLSGGNQQKALLAKWLQVRPVALLLHEPTQGVDVGSRQQVFRIIRETADQGTAVLVASSEYADLANMCSRVLVMRRGAVSTELSGAALTEDRLVQACYSSR